MKKLPFKNKFLLAPMEDINDIAFRLLCKKAGAGLTYTGLTHPLTKQKIDLDDKPGLQIFCINNKGVKEFMKKYDSKVSLWDLNLGCPAKSAKKHGFGSFLKDTKQIEEILKTMRESTKKPVTIKIRKSELSFKMLELAEKYCDAICIHPRTQAQGYSGKPDIEFAEKLKETTKLPLIYSGDINLKNSQYFLKKFDYIMIGRNAIGDPNIFSRLLKKEPKIDFQDYLKLAKKYKLPFRQIKFQAMCFTKRKRAAKKMRLKIFHTKTLKELEEIYKQ